jgi:hypothetical protein
MKHVLRSSTRRAALIGALFTAVAAVAAAAPRIQTGPGAEVTEDGLHRIDGGTFAYAWAKPGIDLSAYDRVLLLPVELGFRDVKDPGLRRDAHEFPIDDEQRDKLRKTIEEAFVKELGRGERFALTDQPGPGVLEIRGAILDIVSHIPEDPVGRGAVFVKSLGEATLVVEVRDAATREVLARAVDRRAIENMTFSRSNSVNNRSDVRLAVQRLASQLRRRLDELTTL